MSKPEFSKQQLVALHQIARELARPGELDRAMQATLELLDKRLGLRRGLVSILRRDLGEIQTIAGGKLGQAQIARARFQPGEGITGKVVQSGRPIAVPRLDREPLFLDRSGSRKGLDRAELAFICVPVRYGDEVVGALSVDCAAGPELDLELQLALLAAASELIASRVTRRRMIEENKLLRESVGAAGADGLILGKSEGMRQVRYLIGQVADSNTSVLLSGETGTGKGLVARAIHRQSSRRDQPFVHLNCGAIPEHLVESELFGHARGAFTGAVKAHAGRFEAAGSGTLFLDEVNELPQQAQVKLLRVLQDREYERVGSGRTLHAGARVVAASNRDLERDVEQGRFRPDLFYRLNVFPIHIPPLRERGADVMMLADHFTKVYAEQQGKRIERIETPAIDMLMAYHWPGNVRELENAVERAALLANDGVLRAHLLPPSLQIKAMESRTIKRGRLEKLVAAYEMELIVDALKDSGGNQSRAAELLGTTRRVIQYKVQQYDIDFRKFRRSG